MHFQLLLAVTLVATTVLGFPESRTDSRVAVEPSSFPLYGLLPNFNDIFERMRQQFAYLANAIPASGGNTTSVTKEINGHKVVINETVYSNGPGFEFHVRVIDIKPDETSPSSTSEHEMMQDDNIQDYSASNLKSKRKINNGEIPDRENLEILNSPVYSNYIQPYNKPPRYNSIESLEKSDPSGNNIETFDETDYNIETFNDDLDSLDGPIHEKHFETLDGVDGIVDLSNDIYVNEIAAQQGWKQDPNAEVFAHYPHYPNTYGSRPINDLSRDTYVNDLAAKSERVPRHPDAELLPISRFYYRPAAGGR